MPYKQLIYEKKDRIAYVTLNRPHRLNALHPLLGAEMREAFSDFRDDPEVWVAILTGAGDRAFSAGADLKWVAGIREEGEEEPPQQKGQVSLGDITKHFDCWKPIIAAVNGFALGGGLELALSCDIIIAADHAELGLPEGRVGQVAGTGVHRLPRQIPLKLAMGMILTGRRIKAQEALRLGIVNEVVPAADLMTTAEQWANDILLCAPLSVRASKQMVMTGLDLPLELAMDRSYTEFEKAITAADQQEGAKAFSEKRKPNWTGA
ncbi:MAG: enoyl-CoA hydratase-related protein [Chloroflexi bacterium]|nr:enoyl-CoA hydratase-related protein [Chloroflexota bacterium]